MVFYRGKELSVATEFSQALVVTQILCCDRACGWDGRGERDNVQCARNCACDRPATVYYDVHCLGNCPWALFMKNVHGHR